GRQLWHRAERARLRSVSGSHIAERWGSRVSSGRGKRRERRLRPEMASANQLAKALRTLTLGTLANGDVSLGRVPRGLVPPAPALEAAFSYARAVASPCGY